MGSKPGQFTREDFNHVVFNGGIVVLSAIVSYLLQTLPGFDFGKNQVYVTAFLFILGYVAKRYAIQN